MTAGGSARGSFSEDAFTIDGGGDGEFATVDSGQEEDDETFTLEADGGDNEITAGHSSEDENNSGTVFSSDDDEQLVVQLWLGRRRRERLHHRDGRRQYADGWERLWRKRHDHRFGQRFRR
ncbi:MAG: hypothetical protein R2849_19495 [Thermomicrobiales bacterium]